MKKLLIGVGLGSVALGALGAWLVLREPEEPPVVSETTAGGAEGLPLPGGFTGPLVDYMAITEAVEVPKAVLVRQRLKPPVITKALEADAKAIRDLHATWNRGNNGLYPFLYWDGHRGFEAADLWVRAVQTQDLDTTVMIGPWSGLFTGNFTTEYRVGDMEAYTDWVESVVERYDGDGVDDMPGLKRPIKVWEVDNEPDLANAQVPRDAKRDYDASQFCTPPEYAEVLLATSAAIRRADPDALVMNGGFYRPMTDQGMDYMEALFAIPGTREAIDIVSIHAYFEGPGVDRVEKAITNTRELLPDKPIWLTETSSPSEGKRPWMDETWQAETVVQVYALGLELGVEKVFWHSLVDPPPRVRKTMGPGPITNSLYEAQVTQGQALEELRLKPAGAAFKLLAQAMEGVNREDVRQVSGGLQLGDTLLLLEGQAEGSSGVRIATGEQLPGPVFDAADGAVLVR